MRSWQTRAATLLLMLILPFQGLAASLSPMLCHTEEHHAAADSVSGHYNGHPHHSTDTVPAGEQNSTSDYAGHLCCSIAFAAVPMVTAGTTPLEPTFYTLPDSVSPPLFVPERLQRPPRT